jgi:hypothetical protein
LLTKEGDKDVIVVYDQLNDGDHETVRTGRAGPDFGSTTDNVL